MKKVVVLIFISWMGFPALFSQQKTIMGTVSSLVDGGGPVPGVTIKLKGTQTGTITDADGRFTIKVPEDADTLLFSCVGMKSQDQSIGGLTVLNVMMEPVVYLLEEVMVTTGYEIKRTPRNISSFTQVLDGQKVNPVRQTNIANALAGKIAGIQFRGQSPLLLDRDGSIRLRGDGGFGKGTNILFVVDGTVLPNTGEIHPDDIEDISVLSGPAASAILGSQGANGAVIITTKKAKAQGDRDLSVEINAGVMTSMVYLLPEFQNEYAGGRGDTLKLYTWENDHPVEWQSLDGKRYHDYEDDNCWGPRMEGQEYIPWYSWYPGSKYTGTTASLIPQPDNVRDFYERGMTYNNTIAFTKHGEKVNLHAFLGNVAVKGNLPGSSSNRTIASLRSSIDLGKRITFHSNLNYQSRSIHGEFNDGGNNPTTGSFNAFFHRNIDMEIMKELRGLRSKEGIYASWNHANPNQYDPATPEYFYKANFFFNPYTYFDHFEIPVKSDRFFGDISLSCRIVEGLSAKITYRRHQNSSWQEERYSSDLNDSQILAASPWYSPKAKGYYASYSAISSRENFESLISYRKEMGSFAFHAHAGSDFFSAISKSNGANTVNGLSVPNLYTIENSVDQPQIFNGRTQEKYRALFLRGDAGYKNILFVDFTLRNDWFSSLPPQNNSVFSKSLGASFVFSDLTKLSFLDYGKLRFSWGEIPTAIPIYTYPGGQYSYNLFQWNGNLLTTTPDVLVDQNIHGAAKTQQEVGLDTRFLGNRLGLSATFWTGSEKGIPYPVAIPGYTGYTIRYANTGEISKQGLDLAFHARAVSNRFLNYEIHAVMAYLIKNQVVKIYDRMGEDSTEIAGFIAEDLDVYNWWEGLPAMTHEEGQTWGMLKGTGMKMWNGKPILNENGQYVKTIKNYGSVLPKITGGIQNSFRILNKISIDVNFDYQIGGKYFSFYNMFGARAGVLARTAENNDLGNPIRDPVDPDDLGRSWISGDDAVPGTGGVHISGIDEETYEEVDYYIDAEEYFFDYTEGAGIYDPYVYDLTYLKLNELAIGYQIPVHKIKGLSNYLQDIRISLTAVNLWLIYAQNRDFDPSEIHLTGGECGMFPGTRSFGINLKVNF